MWEKNCHMWQKNCQMWQKIVTCPSNLKKKKIKEPLYVTKELSNMILELHYVIIEPSNVRKK